MSIPGAPKAFSAETDAGGATQPAYQKISQELRVQENAGLTNLAWKIEEESPLSPALIDINWLSSQPLLPFLVKAIPAQLLYQSMLAYGFEECIEVAEWIRGEQLIAMLDFDLWRQDEETAALAVLHDRFYSWLRLWFEISPEFAAERILDLEEESLVILFSSLLEIRPEGISVFSDDAKEEYWLTNDGRFYLKMKDPRPEAFEFVHQLLDALYKKNVRVAQSILAYSAMLVTQEAMELEMRWREGRLADAGFVTAGEAAEILKPRPLRLMRNEVKSAIAQEKSRQSVGDSALETVTGQLEFDTVHGILESLPEEVAPVEIMRVLGSERWAVLSNDNKVSKNSLLQDEDVIDEAVEGIRRQCARLLSMVQTAPLRNKAQKELLLVESAIASISEEDETEAASLKARLGRTANAVASLGGENFQSRATLTRAITVVRGSLNIGLEMAVADPAAYGIVDADPTDPEETAVTALRLFGPEFLFKLGWAALAELQMAAAESFDAQFLEVPTLARNLKSGRMIELRIAFEQNASDMGTAAKVVLENLFNRIPLFAEVLNSASGTRASADARPFETLAEVKKVEGFLKSADENIGE